MPTPLEIIAGSASLLGDQDMMEGYIAAESDPSNVIDVAVVIVNGIDLASLNWDSYDV